MLSLCVIRETIFIIIFFFPPANTTATLNLRAAAAIKSLLMKTFYLFLLHLGGAAGQHAALAAKVSM